MANPKEAPPAKAAKSGGGAMMMIVVLVAGLGIGGGGAWFAAKKFAAPAQAAGTEEHAEADEHGAAPADEHGGGGGDGHGGGGSVAEGEVTYVPLSPAFVVNLEDLDVVRYLQVEVEVSARRAVVADEIKLHMPVIRNALLMLFSEQDYRNLLKVEGKEKLRQDALAEVRRVMKEQTGAAGVDNLYFTSFVSQ